MHFLIITIYFLEYILIRLNYAYSGLYFLEYILIIFATKLLLNNASIYFYTDVYTVIYLHDYVTLYINVNKFKQLFEIRVYPIPSVFSVNRSSNNSMFTAKEKIFSSY